MRATDPTVHRCVRPARLLAVALATTLPGLARADASCPSWSGFDAVGDIWEYSLSLALFSGWERWELVGLDEVTGEVTVFVTGERVADAFVESYERTDLWRCDEDGLWSMGWSATWTITGVFGDFEVSGDATNDWDASQLFLPQDPLEGDTWDVRMRLDTTTSAGDESNNRGAGTDVLSVGAITDDVVLGEVVPVLPVSRTSDWMAEAFQDSYTSWYAEDIGLVRRDDLVLIEHTPAP